MWGRLAWRPVEKAGACTAQHTSARAAWSQRPIVIKSLDRAGGGPSSRRMAVK